VRYGQRQLSGGDQRRGFGKPLGKLVGAREDEPRAEFGRAVVGDGDHTVRPNSTGIIAAPAPLRSF
jgi:hypothetical protein